MSQFKISKYIFSLEICLRWDSYEVNLLTRKNIYLKVFCRVYSEYCKLKFQFKTSLPLSVYCIFLLTLLIVREIQNSEYSDNHDRCSDIPGKLEINIVIICLSSVFSGDQSYKSWYVTPCQEFKNILTTWISADVGCLENTLYSRFIDILKYICVFIREKKKEKSLNIITNCFALLKCWILF